MRITAILSLALTLAAPASAQLSAGSWKTDLSKKSIDLSELKSGGPPKDGIPAIHNPVFVSPQAAARWLNKSEPVLVVEHAGEARAYPLQILLWHELVNDRIEDLPVLVSFCPLRNAALAFDRRVEGQLCSVGVSGLLRNSDMVMYDRETDSLWQQATGEAIVGDLTGKRLDIVSSQIVPFEVFQQSFTAGKVLSRETGHSRSYGETPYVGYEFGKRLMFPVGSDRRIPVPPLERLVTIEVGDRARAYPLTSIRRWKTAQGKLSGEEYVVFFEPSAVTPMDSRRIADSRAVGTVGVFSPMLEGRRLKFGAKGNTIWDEQTGSRWNILGMAVEGPLKGQRLRPIQHSVFYAFAWLAFRPDTEVLGVPNMSGDRDSR
jgi:hypothetical protein